VTTNVLEDFLAAYHAENRPRRGDGRHDEQGVQRSDRVTKILFAALPSQPSPAGQALVAAAVARRDARPVKRIDYDGMRRVFPKQKAALTRARKTGDPEKVAGACKKAVKEWNEIGAWPDDWSAWQRALDDVLPWHQRVDIADL